MKIVGCMISPGSDGPRLWIKMETGHGFYVDPASVSRLADRPQHSLANMTISKEGDAIEWGEPDFCINVVQLLELVLSPTGFETYLRSRAASRFGSSGGRARTEAKGKASRENGKKGGRPRKNADSSAHSVEF